MDFFFNFIFRKLFSVDDIKKLLEDQENDDEFPDVELLRPILNEIVNVIGHVLTLESFLFSCPEVKA